MGIMEGTGGLKSWKGSWDFAVDGGAISTIVLRSNDGPMPAVSYIVSGLVDVLTALTSGGAGTGALTVEAANDIVTAAAVSGAPWSTTGRKSIIPVGTGVTAVKTTVTRSPSFVIAAVALTAGKFDLILFYK